MKQQTWIIAIALTLAGCTQTDADREVQFSDLLYRGGIAYAVPADSKRPEESPYTGWALEIYENGLVRLSGQFVNGKPDGQWDLWRDDQTLWVTVSLSADGFFPEKEDCNLLVDSEGKVCLENFASLVRHDFSQWYLNGQIAKEIKYQDSNPQALDGEQRENGQDFEEATDKDFMREGLAREWYENGQLSREAPYKGDKLAGQVREWHENGQLWWEVPYEDGMRQGLARGWHGNGQLYQEAPYSDDKLEGLVRDWHENGQLWWEVPYVNGEREGLARGWHENGQLYLEETYVNGRREGPSQGWLEDGEISWEGVFRDDELVEGGWLE